MTDDDEPAFEIFPVEQRCISGAYFWDDLIENLPEWRELKYTWIGRSMCGDQIIVTENSPLHAGTAIHVHGPDIAGPISAKAGWIENILYLGDSVEDWLIRVERFGGEHSMFPGSIDELGSDADEYRAIYRKLNPGLQW
jgi:hypothetical protein